MSGTETRNFHKFTTNISNDVTADPEKMVDPIAQKLENDESEARYTLNFSNQKRKESENNEGGGVRPGSR